MCMVMCTYVSDLYVCRCVRARVTCYLSPHISIITITIFIIVIVIVVLNRMYPWSLESFYCMYVQLKNNGIVCLGSFALNIHGHVHK